jgi:hypothetical protein
LLWPPIDIPEAVQPLRTCLFYVTWPKIPLSKGIAIQKLSNAAANYDLLFDRPSYSHARLHVDRSALLTGIFFSAREAISRRSTAAAQSPLASATENITLLLKQTTFGSGTPAYRARNGSRRRWFTNRRR